LYYLTEKGTRPRPAPCLITHYLLNDPGQVDASRPYVPLGRSIPSKIPGSFESGTSKRESPGVMMPQRFSIPVHESLGVNTPEDRAEAERRLSGQS
jgi:hypothetical protein